LSPSILEERQFQFTQPRGISIANPFSRVNAAIRQTTGEWPRSAEAKEWAESAASR
jgi:ABC-type uncharacterized transport system YnjBCD ATPase subunit